MCKRKRTISLLIRVYNQEIIHIPRLHLQDNQVGDVVVETLKKERTTRRVCLKRERLINAMSECNSSKEEVKKRMIALM